MMYKDDESVEVEVEVVVPAALKLMKMERNRDYVVLRTDIPEEEEVGDLTKAEVPPSQQKRSGFWWWWLKIVFMCIFGIAALVVAIIWVIPFLLHKEVIPLLDWEIRTFRPEELGILLFSSLVLFPSLLMPSSPSIWVAGISFGYFFGFLLTLPGMSIGMSIPYFIGSLFRHKIHAWLERWPEKAAFMRLAGEGSWFQQFRTVVLLRISPFPFILYNYAAVATNVKYGPYIAGSVVGVVPEIFVTIYSGILIRTLADASQSHTSFSRSQIICNVLGFIATTGSTVTITIYSRRALKKLQNGEELLLE